jgi:hypothetical protein
VEGCEEAETRHQTGWISGAFQSCCPTYASHAVSSEKEMFGHHWLFVSDLTCNDWRGEEWCLDR